ncbi:hypothetical protein [Paenalcaligenes faecalis]|uniref:hypothetical protein n=1 Tax=Paenalcaligenes faecalis TaxID=2980099 RepID=UPI0022B98A64|nr:hypothetical protein [Paenalcaligenes faecalis]
MALVLGAGAYCEWLEAVEILAAVGFSEGQARSLAAQGVTQASLATEHSLLVTGAEQLAELSQLLNEYPQRKVILLYADLPLTLTAITTQTQTPVKEALHIWQKSLDQLQAFYRKHREQTLLFELGQLLQYPRQFLQVCATEWQQEQPSFLDDVESKHVLLDSEYLALAKQLRHEQPELSQCLQYTQAMTWPLGDNFELKPTPFSAYELLDRIQQKKVDQLEIQQKITTITADFNKVKQENTLVLEQLEFVQEDLEKQLLAKSELQQQLTELQQLFSNKEQEQAKLLKEKQELAEQAQDQVVELTKENNELRQENQLLLEQLFLVQEELEQKIVVKRSLRQELEDLQNQVKKLKAQTTKNEQAQTQVVELTTKNEALTKELAEVKANHEQSLIAQSDAVKQAQELSQENQLILEQLFLVQEELEKYILAEREAISNTTEPPATAQPEETESRDLVVASDLRIHAPDHTVLPRSFFERRAYKKEQRLARRKDRERAAQIAQTPWFDAAWYLEQYPDIAADPVQSENPALHYMRMGGFEGRNPSPHFDSAFYLASNPDVVEAGLNPLWHFLRHGQAEGRQPQP